jgi:hypothetical protein
VARVLVTVDDKSEAHVDLPIRAMGEARLVLTDDLIRAALRREKAALKEARRPGRRSHGAASAKLAKPSTNSNRKAAARGAAHESLGPDEGDTDGR